jgi:methyl-accepting chemotaxis protein
MPAVGLREIVAAIHHRRDRRRASAAELAKALTQLAERVEQHVAKIADVRAAVEAQGGDLSHLQHYDNVMARLRAELRAAERSLASAFADAARQ